MERRRRRIENSHFGLFDGLTAIVNYSIILILLAWKEQNRNRTKLLL